ncbi:hypothetical protein FRC10_008440 [Ceratobasidium sp. 414]|nr:hypothetical protein FRC10_008440 [Ceratobasidium sp. 414]
MPKVSTARKDVKVGQRIWARVLLNADALKEDALQPPVSTTMQGIIDGISVLKILYVTQVMEDRLMAHFCTSFGGSALEDMVDDTSQWRNDPTGKGWVYIGAEFPVYGDPVDVLTN